MVTDKNFLLWIYDRLRLVHGEPPNLDYMIKLHKLAFSQKVESAALKSFEVRAFISRGRVLFYCRLNKANVIIVGFDVTDSCTGYAHLESDEDKYIQVDLNCLELPR